MEVCILLVIPASTLQIHKQKLELVPGEALRFTLSHDRVASPSGSRVFRIQQRVDSWVLLCKKKIVGL